MVDLKQECSEESGEQQNASQSQSSSDPMKSCTGCQTTTTPLWRGGPAGPKTLCNACGIKYHKKRRALLGLQSGKSDKPKCKKKIKICSSAGRLDDEGKSSVRVPLKIKMVMKRFNGGRNLGEEEQAALLLMALSCGSLSMLEF